MTFAAPAESLETFQTKAFARHMLFDLPFPVMGTALVLGLMGWVLHGHVANAWIVMWILFGALVVLARETFVHHMKARVNQGEGHLLALRGTALFSMPMGAISGAFACMYFDAQRPMTLTILGTYMTVVVVGAVVPSSVYLPGFYLLVLSAHVPYLGLLLYTGGTEHLVVAGINILFLVVVFSYAHAANRMQREAMRLRYENQRLIGDLEVRKAEAESASRTKSLFLAGVSHDLKQPIRAIGLYTGYLRHSAAQDNAPASVVMQTAEKIEAATAAVHGQITRLLELSRLESGAAPVHRVPLRLDERIARAVELMLPEAQARGVAVHCRVVGKVMLESDIRMLDSILTNLLGNAIKHAQATRVLVAVRRHRSGLCLEVRDNGVGIPPERLPQLFEAYRSFDDRQTSDSHGLGLAIVRAQAGYLGAQITVRSAPGQGSVFALEGLG